MSEAPFSVCVVIPVYNHAHLVRGPLEQVSAAGLDAVLVNDGGDSEATATLRALAEEFGAHLVEQFPNAGKGVAVLAGMQRAQQLGFTHVVQVDADGQHNLADLPRLVDEARRQPEAVIAGVPRYDESVPRHRLYSRYITHVWVWIETLSLEIVDSMCGFRVYPLAPTMALARRERIGRRMDFDTEILVRLHWRGLRVVNVPTQVVYPERGVSNFRLWGDNLAITWMHTRLVLGMLWRAPVILARRLGRRA